ncbi:MAG: Glycine-tRNA ligase [Candidatus Woesebacteria bacterium GW2011_GWC2_45_9]|uniref:Glycine--tRNA ligase n=2 Tax=Microgenomates group TaxID=1794810 RepID=A0A0G1R8C3_9BACT|nr:MAG: Glycine-tRNA ligase [Candidatus Curtissbacteria bacterium GW2011_GWC1_44_33]KKU17145.1 MAG: Glycine-tRNA ligase [Candidatus Woesebacteria bacterium GW2011_GWC2_45_9]
MALYYNQDMDIDKQSLSPSVMEKIFALAKRRGFIYPGSEIYGGLANTYDFGPLGVELKNNIKKLWWKRFVHDRSEVYGLDGGIIVNPKIWKASGHVESFVDPLVECKVCHHRFRADQLKDSKVCPNCSGELTEPKMFNGMFKTFVGATEDEGSLTYLRPETAQNIFVNFSNIVDTFSPPMPFGIAQIGKAFRNEITTGQFIFRTLEFEQMEIEYFIRPEGWERVFEMWQEEMLKWAQDVGIGKEKLKFREHSEKERSHYSKKTLDLEYEFPGGFKEIYGLAYRGDFDLVNHSKHSGKKLLFRDPNGGDEFVPHVVEPSFGVERTLLPMLLDAYSEEKERVILKLKPQLAPYKVAVFPLLANKEDLIKRAYEVYELLRPKFYTAWDDRGNIGKRYFSQDEIGTPWCVTIDFATLDDETVTVRDRDSTKQERVAIDKLSQYLENKLYS